MQRKQTRLAVQKTYKLFISGKFVRAENGRMLPGSRKSRGAAYIFVALPAHVER
ncbi:MAG TPA: hypothetical protein VM717_09500 [Chthoniobacterales bacterium]|nr:hypothetical protein [Chthoniobacterales bacterium]